MKINVKSISILLNILFLCGGLYLIYFFKDKIIKKIESKKQFDVVLYGDSLIEDFEWQPKNREIKLTNIGYGGITTSELVWYIKDNVILKKPKICFLEGGINDLTNGIPIERTISNYSDMVDTLLHYNVKPSNHGYRTYKGIFKIYYRSNSNESIYRHFGFIIRKIGE
jgi:lysophospholipase L1-like esterase